MAVIDGKYEILSQRALDEGQTFFSATAPDGAALSIVWFDLTTPQQEVRFERYRQLLRTLKKQGWAALHEVVSRPGAHYVVWYAPAPGQQSKAADKDLEHILRSHGYSSEQADIRSAKSGHLVYALAFGEAAALPEPASPPRPRGKPAARPPLPLWLLQWGLGVALLSVGSLFFYTSFKLGVNDALVTVPELTSLPVNEAAQTLYDLKLGVEPSGVASDAPPYSVLELAPAPGSETRPGTTVRLNYALPAGQVALVTVPQLRGADFTNQLAEQLAAVSLRLGDVAYVHSNVAEGVVIAQSREAGTQTNEGAAVHLLVSEGPRPQETFVPNLVGLPLEDALALARLTGVSVTEPEERPGGRYAPGTVLAQSIAPGASVPLRGAELRLSVADGGTPPPERPVPSLVGMSRAAATRTAAEAGFDLEIQTVDSDTESLNLPEGVVNQSPPPGGAATDTTVSILLNQRPVPTPRPAVTATFRPPQARTLTYTFDVERGISTLQARVKALTVSGKEYQVLARTVTGGERLSGTWRTSEPGPVTFQLFLGTDPEPYAQARVNP